MKRGPFLLVVAVLALAGSWWSLARLARDAPEARLGDPHGSTAFAEVPHLEGSVSPANRSAEFARESVDAVHAEAASPDAPDCTVLGRVLDPSGNPLVGFAVALHAPKGPWSSELEAPIIEVQGRGVAGYSTSTDSSGAFTFAVAMPAAYNIALHIEPDALHTPAERFFDAWDSPLRAGENDLGEIRLGMAGAVEGSVRSVDGAAIASAAIVVQATHGSPVGTTRTDSEGHFMVGGLAAGRVRIRTSASGYLRAEGDWIDIQLGEVRHSESIVLLPSPTIAGRVVDELEQPVAGATVRARPEGGGFLAESTTSQDGAFTVHLTQDTPHWLRAEHPECAIFDGSSAGALPPGARDARVQLTRLGSIRLRVVEREGGAPIERFGLVLEAVQISVAPGRLARDLEIADHPGGWLELPRPEGHLFAHVDSPGHAPATIAIGGDAAAGSETWLRLARASTVRGRVVVADSPTVGARVLLDRARIDLPRILADGSQSSAGHRDAERYDLDPYPGRLRVGSSDAGGRFAFDGLASGTYRLRIVDGRNAPMAMEPFAVREATEQDLGDLELLPAGTLRGHVFRGSDGPAEHWRIGLGARRSGPSRVIGSDGRFEVTGIAPGSYDLWVMPPGSRVLEHVQSVSIAAGETTEIELDVADRTPGRVHLRVMRAGAPLAGFHVEFTWAGEGGARDRTEARTDSRGLALVTLPSGVRADAAVVARSGFEIARTSSPIEVGPGARIEETLEVEGGELELVFPDDLSIPPGTQAFLSLRPVERGRPPLRAALEIPHERSADVPGILEWTGRVLDTGIVPAGSYRVDVRIDRLAAKPDEASRWTRETLAQYGGSVDVRPFSRSSCSLTLGPGGRSHPR